MSDVKNIFELYLENAEQQKSPTMSVDDQGTERWTLDGIYHRLDGPAIVYNDGARVWYSKGKLHRVDGPAVECDGGYKEWYIDNRKYYNVAKWAIAALKFEGKDINDANIQDKMQQVMQQDLFD